VERRFYFSLARELGMTVKQLLASLDSRELSEWIAYFNLEKKKIDTQMTNTEKIKAFFSKKRKK
jgi:hypothetical protein